MLPSQNLLFQDNKIYLACSFYIFSKVSQAGLTISVIVLKTDFHFLLDRKLSTHKMLFLINVNICRVNV